jgi:hypothetical protein
MLPLLGVLHGRIHYPIPILGHLDDLVLIPLGVMLALRVVPKEVMQEYREKAKEIMAQGKPVSKAAVGVIMAIWVFLAALCVFAPARILIYDR